MKKTIATITAALTILAVTGCSSSSDTESTSRSTTENSTATSDGDTAITITANGQTISATLNDTQVSQDFIETLPTTLTWNRNADIEYITELSAPLTETGPFYDDVEPGDLVYYNPMDSITIIYEPTVSVPTLTKMGAITSDLAVFEDLPDTIDMRIELD